VRDFVRKNGDSVKVAHDEARKEINAAQQECRDRCREFERTRDQRIAAAQAKVKAAADEAEVKLQRQRESFANELEHDRKLVNADLDKALDPTRAKRAELRALLEKGKHPTVSVNPPPLAAATPQAAVATPAPAPSPSK